MGLRRAGGRRQENFGFFSSGLARLVRRLRTRTKRQTLGQRRRFREQLASCVGALRSSPGLHQATVVVAVVLAALHARKRLAKADVVLQQSQDELVLARKRLVGEGEEGTDEVRVDVDDVVFHVCIIPRVRGFVQGESWIFSKRGNHPKKLRPVRAQRNRSAYR